MSKANSVDTQRTRSLEFQKKKITLHVPFIRSRNIHGCFDGANSESK
jgi:hypothetical protein